MVTMSEQQHQLKMSYSDGELQKRPPSQLSNDALSEEALNSEQKMLVEKNEQSNLIKNVNTVQKVDTGRDINGYRFVKVNIVYGI